MMAPTLADPPRTLTLTPGGQAQFRFEKDDELIARLRAALPDAHWNGNAAARCWALPVRAANILPIIEFARAHGFAGVDAAAELREQIREKARRHMVASRAAFDDTFALPTTLRGTLAPFQRAGVKYVCEIAGGRALVADEMGLGKTVQAIAVLETLSAWPAIVVCPASLLYNWKSEFAKWLPDRVAAVFSADSPTDHASTPDAVIVSYDLLADNVEALRALDPAGVVFDEAHMLKTPKCQRTLAAKALRKGVKVRLALTGTPFLNRSAELIAPLSVIGRLDDLGGFEWFAKRYCGAVEEEVRQRGTKERRVVTRLKDSTNSRELAARLRATCMVRRLKADVLPELPPKRTTILPVDLPADLRREYDSAHRDVLDWVAKRAEKDPGFRSQIEGLDPSDQIAAILEHARSAANRAGQAEELVKIEALKQIAARGKVPAAREWISNVVDAGEKLVVFAWHQSTLDALSKAFPAAPSITGDTPTWVRQAIVGRFQMESVERCPLVLMNLQAGGVGLTLTAASNVLILELPWTPALLDQAIDRLHRIGQQSRVNAWLMMARRSIDFAIWQMIRSKRANMEEVTR